MFASLYVMGYRVSIRPNKRNPIFNFVFFDVAQNFSTKTSPTTQQLKKYPVRSQYRKKEGALFLFAISKWRLLNFRQVYLTNYDTWLETDFTISKSINITFKKFLKISKQLKVRHSLLGYPSNTANRNCILKLRKKILRIRSNV